MFITPIDKISDLSELSSSKSSVQRNSSGQPFKDIFMNAVSDVVDTANVAAQDQYRLATGQVDNLHELPIDSTKARLSLELLIQLRNKALDAYNEVMRINL